MSNHNPVSPLVDRIEELQTTIDLHQLSLDILIHVEEAHTLTDALTLQLDVLRDEQAQLVAILNKMAQLTATTA